LRKRVKECGTNTEQKANNPYKKWLEEYNASPYQEKQGCLLSQKPVQILECFKEKRYGLHYLVAFENNDNLKEKYLP
jgi:hypothetical protein